MNLTEVCVLKLGLVSYLKALKIQDRIATILKEGSFPYRGGALLLLEHPSVYTVGLRKGGYTEEDAERLRKTGAEFVRTNRGGLITFHGPGQLVAWPLLRLKHFKPSVRWYVDTIESTVIHMCHNYELAAQRSPHTGVWIGDSKICAIGVHASRFVTTHGLALNCNTDLTWFDHIVPCGVPDKGVTSLSQQLGRNVTIGEIVPRFLDSFQTQFRCQLIATHSSDVDEILKESVM